MEQHHCSCSNAASHLGCWSVFHLKVLKYLRYDLCTDQTKQNLHCSLALWVACVLHRKNQTWEICHLFIQNLRSKFTESDWIICSWEVGNTQGVWCHFLPLRQGFPIPNFHRDHFTDKYLTHSSTGKPIKILPPRNSPLSASLLHSLDVFCHDKNHKSKNYTTKSLCIGQTKPMVCKPGSS